MPATGGFGAKVKLSVDSKNSSQFNKEIEELVSKKKINIGKSLYVTDRALSALYTSIRTALQKQTFEIQSITVKKINAAQAIKDVQRQIQESLGTTTAGTSGTGTSATGGASSAQQATKETIELRGALKALETQVQKLNSVYKSALSGKDMIDEGELAEYTEKYNVLIGKVEEYKRIKDAASIDDVKNAQQEAISIQRAITESQRMKSAVEGTTDSINEQSVAQNRASDAAQSDQKKEIENLRAIAALREQIQRYMNTNTRIRDTGYETSLNAILNGLDGDSLNATDIKNFRAEFAKVRQDVVEAGMTGKSFLDMLSNAYQRFGGWALVTNSLSEVAGGFRQIIQNVRDLDTAMTELQKVTDETDATYAQFFDDAIERSQQVGATLVDTISATSDFARLGYDIFDSAELADAALVYKNVGDGIEDIGTASESIISTMAAFGTETENVMHIVDAFNEVDNRFAISSAGIGEALIRSASGLAAAGNTMEESIALITAMNTTVQNPEKVGTTLKTVTMYLRAAKADMEAAGESTDGMANSVSSLRASILALTDNEVDIMLDEDTFKSTYQIMKELSEVWESMADVDQAALLELIGGKRNSDAVMSLISNFHIAEDALRAANESAGSAMAENEKRMASIEGRITEFNRAFETFSASFLDADLVKGVVDFGSGILNVLTAIVDEAGALPPLLATIAAFFTANSAIHGDDFGLFSIVNTETGKQIGILGNSLSDISTRFNEASQAGVSFGNMLKASLGIGMGEANLRIEQYNQSLRGAEGASKTFINSLSDGNVAMKGYLSTLNGGQASLSGFRDFCRLAGDSLTNLHANYDSISEKINLFNQSLDGADGAQATFISSLGDGDKVLKSYLSQLNGASASIDGYRKYCETASKSVTKLNTQSRLASFGVAALNTALNAVATFGISLAISAIINGIGSLINASAEARQESMDAAQEAKDASDSLYELADAYAALAHEIDVGTGDRDEYISAQDQVIEALELEGKTVAELTAEYGTLRNAIRSITIERLGEQWQEQARGAEDAIDDVESKLNAFFSKHDRFTLIGDLFDNGHRYEFIDDDGETLIGTIGRYRDVEWDEETLGFDPDELRKSIEFLVEQGVEGVSFDDESFSFTLPYSVTWDPLDPPSFEEALANQQAVQEMMDALYEEYGSGNVLYGLLDETYSVYEDALKEAIQFVDDANETLGQQLLYGVDDVATTQEEFIQMRQDLIDQIESSGRFMEGGTYTPDTMVDSILGDSTLYSSLAAEYQANLAMAEESAAIRQEIIDLFSEDESDNIGRIQRQIDTLSYDELQYVHDLIAADGVKTWEDMQAALEEYNSETAQAERSADSIRSSISYLWNSEDFADSAAELTEMVESLGEIDPSVIEELADEGGTLAAILEMDGMNARFLAHIMEELACGNDGLSLITEGALVLNEALDGMIGRFDEVTAAKSRYDQAMSVEEKDAGFRNYAEAFEELNNQFVAGTTNSNAFWAAAEFLFGEEQLAAWGWSDGLDEIYAAMQRNVGIFGDAESAGAGFLDRLYAMSQAGQLVDDLGNQLAEISRAADGSYTFDIDEENIDELADKMGLAEEAVLASLQAISMWGDVNFYDLDEVVATMDELGLSAEYAGGRVVDLESFETQLKNLGKNAKEIYDLKEQLFGLGNVTFLDTRQDIGELLSTLTNLQIAVQQTQENGTITYEVNVSDLGGLMSDLEFTEDRSYALVEALAGIDGVSLTNASGQIINLNDALAELDNFTFQGVNEEQNGAQKGANDLRGAVQDARTEVDKLDDEKLNGLISELDDAEDAALDLRDALERARISMNRLNNSGSSLSNKGPSASGIKDLLANSSRSYAGGTDSAPAGPALVGEEDPELILSEDRAVIAGVNGPEFVNLNRGDTVYSADQTRAILRRSGRGFRGVAPAYAAGRLGNQSFVLSDGGGSTSGSVTITTSGSGTKGSAFGNGVNTSTNKYPGVLDDISDSASNAAGSVSDLSEATSNLDEAINALIDDYEHELFLLEHRGGSYEEMIAVYRKMQDAVYQQAEQYRAMGLDENDDYIQAMQQQWFEYQDAINDLIAQAYDDAIREQENAVSNMEHVLDQAYQDRNLLGIQAYTGDIVSYYRNMQEIIQQQAEYYHKKGYEDTSDEISNLIDLWYEYEEAVADVKQQVVDHLVDMVSQSSDVVDEFQNVYDALHAAADEFAQNGGFISVDAYQDIIALGPEYMQFLKDENGLLKINEESINRVIEAKTREMALQSAMNYVERLRLALNSESIEDLNQLLFATTETTNATWGLVYANLALLDLSPDQYQAALHNINAIRALAENAVQSIGQVSGGYMDELEEMQSGLDSILEYVMDMLEDRVERQIDALEEMKDSYAELIDLKKESLEASKDETDYQDEVADKIQEIADLQARINALSLDDSRDAQAQRIELEQQMAELQEELADTQADHALEAQQDSLDSMQEAYEEQKDQEIAALEETISSTQKLYLQAISYIESHWSTLLSELKQWNYEMGTEFESTIVSAWEAALAAAQKYGSYVNAINQIGTDIENAQNGSSGGNLTVGGSISGSEYTDEEMVRAIVSQMRAQSAGWMNGDAAYREQLHKKAAQYAARLPQYGVTARFDDPSGVWYIEEDELNPSNVGKKLYSVYHKGGVAGDQPTLKQNEVMAVLEKGEPVLDKKKEEGLWTIIDFASELSERLGNAVRAIDIAGVFGTMRSDIFQQQNAALAGIAGDRGNQVVFGDVYIYGSNNETVKQHIDVNRRFVNEVLDKLNIRK